MELPSATQRLLQAASALGLDLEVREFPESTKTASDAAEAIGCDVGAIVKSLVFMVDGEPVITLVPGDMRVDLDKLTALLDGEEARRATLDEVRAATGYAAGGTPPFGHAGARPRILADQMLARHSELWAAAGTPTTVFAIDHESLVDAARADIVDLTDGKTNGLLAGESPAAPQR